MEPTSAHLLDRQIKTITSVSNSRLNLSVFQWNALARCYSGSKHYPLLSRQAVHFDNRKGLLSREIKSYESDIICLEEVDHQDTEFFKTLYPDSLYSFNFVKKPHSKDGTCIMLKKPIQVVETEAVLHKKEENDTNANLISQVVVAKCPCKDGEISLIVATCHLKANNGLVSCSDVRTLQVKQLMDVIKRKKQKCLEANKDENVVVVVCGDFNEGPECVAAQEFLVDQDIGLKGVFSDEEYTLYQMFGKNDYTVKMVADNVLYSKNVIPTKKIGAPVEGRVGEDGLLSEEFPSDHLSLYCELAFPEK